MNNPSCTLAKSNYLVNLAWSSVSAQAAQAGKPVPCRGCGRSFELFRLFRCFHCGAYFCPDCAGLHFGPRKGRQFELFLPPGYNGLLVCRDEDCQCRKGCPHAEPHEVTDECYHVCGAEEPCSRCFPVTEAPS